MRNNYQGTKTRMVRLLLTVIMLLTMSASAFADEGYEEALESVVRIYTTHAIVVLNNDTGEYVTDTKGFTGSGIAVGKDGQDPDRFLTNKHVVEITESEIQEWLEEIYDLKPALFDGACKYTTETAVYVVFDDLDTKKEASRIIKSDKYDLACVVLPNSTDLREPAVFALYDEMGREKCWSLGFPGISDSLISDSMWTSLPSSLKYCTVTDGMTQFLTENSEMGSCVQHTAEISGGNSGGPLVNEKGQVIGVNTWGIADGAVQTNIAQNTSQVKQFLESESIDAEYKEISDTDWVLIIAAAVASAAVIAVVIVLIVRKNKKAKKQTAGEIRTLIVQKGTLGTGKEFVLRKGKACMIGTEAGKCTVCFPRQTPGVSHIHCTVLFDGHTVKVKDEGSSYGTFIDDQKISRSGEAVLHRGHTLSIGSSREKLVLR